MKFTVLLIVFFLAAISIFGLSLLPTAKATAFGASPSPMAISGTPPTPGDLAHPGIAAIMKSATPDSGALAICPNPGYLEGVDASVFNGTVDWTQVAQTKSFAYVKATEGTTYIDPTFQTNYAGIKAAGMKAGAYLFFRPELDPTQQANLFVSQLQLAGFAPGDLVPIVDVELTDGQTSTAIISELQTTVTYIESTLSVVPGIYTAAGFWNAGVGSMAFGSLPLWTANWDVSCPTVPTGWAGWSVWQYSDSGSVAGFPNGGPVDLNRSNGPTLPVWNGRTTPTPVPTVGPYRTYLPVIMKNLSSG